MTARPDGCTCDGVRDALQAVYHHAPSCDLWTLERVARAEVLAAVGCRYDAAKALLAAAGEGLADRWVSGRYLQAMAAEDVARMRFADVVARANGRHPGPPGCSEDWGTK